MRNLNAGPEKSVDSTSSLPPSSSHLSQTWIKNFALAANPDASAGPRKLRIQKRDVQEGLGEYTLSVWSDSVRHTFSSSLSISHADRIYAVLRWKLHLAPNRFPRRFSSLQHLQHPTLPHSILLGRPVRGVHERSLRSRRPPISLGNVPVACGGQ
jgi:hypothetical protein